MLELVTNGWTSFIHLFDIIVACLDFFLAMAQPPTQYVLPELFDEAIDKEHGSYLSAVCGTVLGTDWPSYAHQDFFL